MFSISACASAALPAWYEVGAPWQVLQRDWTSDAPSAARGRRRRRRAAARRPPVVRCERATVAGDECLFLGIRELGVRVQQRVLDRRHVVGHGVCELIDRRQARVVREVGDTARLVDVVLHDPGERRDVRRPPPVRLVAVAVVARGLRERLGLRVGPLEGVGGRRVGVAGAPIRHELDEDEQHDRGADHPHKGLPPGAPAAPCRAGHTLPLVGLPLGALYPAEERGAATGRQAGPASPVACPARDVCGWHGSRRVW